MSFQVTLEVTRGQLSGKTHQFSGPDRIFIGRQEDCGLVLPENTISRYHCVLEIKPPKVLLQDFGSRNGTYLNGELIGKRAIDQSFEEGKDQEHQVHTLQDGDRLGLGTKCELQIHIEAGERCARCGKDLPTAIEEFATVVEDDGEDAVLYRDENGARICGACDRELRCIAQEEKQRREAEEKKRREAEAKKQREEARKLEEEARKRQEAEAQAAQLAAQMAAGQEKKQEERPSRKKCVGCGKFFSPKAPDNDLCESCLADRGNVLNAILNQLNVAAPKPVEAPLLPSPVEGYEKVKLLGRGGMGEVWKVREKKTGKYFALKTMLPEAAADERAKQLFLRESAVGQCLKHKNVVRSYRSGCSNGVFFLLMDLCEGGSVDNLMAARGGKLDLALATYIILQVLDGLDYVHNMDMEVEIKRGFFGGTKETHTKGVVHRDFKPGNIFLSDRSDHPVAMVADFGMAKAFDAAGLSRVTKTGAVSGTPVFMPRQQALNFKYSKPEVDVWAAAASYYNMLTGALPKDFRPGKNVWQVIVSESAVPIRKRNRDIPEKLAAVIDRALTEQPAIGYQSAAALRRDIIGALPPEIRNAVKGAIK